MPDVTTVQLSHFGVLPNTGADTTPILRDALKTINPNGSKKLVFNPGRYDFWPYRAFEHYLFPSNNDAGLRRVAFALGGVIDWEIDGQGAEFIFHGMVIPFAIMNSAHITLRNFSVDWERPFHTEAEILKLGPRNEENQRTVVDLKIPEQYPYTIKFNQLFFTDDTPQKYPVRNSLEFDPVKKEPAFLAWDNWHHKDYHYAEELEPGIVRFTSAFSKPPTPGNILAITHTERDTPGIFLSDCDSFMAYDVTLHHAGAMGLIAQRSVNIHLERFKVTPPANKERIVSATADATHFVNCGGQVNLIDCHFQGQLDDATNVHGIYTRISKFTWPNQIEVELANDQQYGVHVTFARDRVEFIDRDTLLTYHQCVVKDVEILNKQFSRLTLDSPLPKNLKLGDAVENLKWVPNLTIRGCTATKNRARGFLISTRGKVMIENNRFHVPSPAIVIAGDARGWFESGAVRDITIRNNHFDNCNYGADQCGVIEIMPEIDEKHRKAGYYHSGIVVEHNTFDVFNPRLVRGHSVDGFTFRNNLISLSQDYPAAAKVKNPIDLTDSKNVVSDVDKKVFERLGAE